MCPHWYLMWPPHYQLTWSLTILTLFKQVFMATRCGSGSQLNVTFSTPCTTKSVCDKFMSSDICQTLLHYAEKKRLFTKLCHFVPFFKKFLLIWILSEKWKWKVPFFIWNIKKTCAARGSLRSSPHPSLPPPTNPTQKFDISMFLYQKQKGGSFK